MNKSKKYKSKIKYQRHYVTVETDEPIRLGICLACKQRVGEKLKVTQNHHWRYAYSWETIKKNPQLALDNVSEYGYCCHPVADALRLLCERDPYKVLDVIDSAPIFIRERLNKLLRLIVNGNRFEGSRVEGNTY